MNQTLISRARIALATCSLAVTPVCAEPPTESKPATPQPSSAVNQSYIDQQIGKINLLIEDSNSNLAKLPKDQLTRTRESLTKIVEVFTKTQKLLAEKTLDLNTANSILSVSEAGLREIRELSALAVIKKDADTEQKQAVIPGGKINLSVSNPVLDAAIERLSKAGNGDPIQGALNFLGQLQQSGENGSMRQKMLDWREQVRRDLEGPKKPSKNNPAPKTQKPEK